MNKDTLVHEIAEKANLTIKDAKAALEAFMATITETVLTEKITLVGFGTFESVDRAARVARNPKSGETIDVPAKKAVKFKAGKELKKAVVEA